MWNTVTQISTGIALTAFMIAAAVTIYRLSLKNRLNEIKTVPAKDRANVIRTELNRFKITAENLSQKQQYDLAVHELSYRRTKLLAVTTLIVIIFIIAAAVAVSSMLLTSPPSRATQPTSPGVKKENFAIIVVRVSSFEQFINVGRSLGFRVNSRPPDPGDTEKDYTVISVGDQVPPDVAGPVIRLAKQYLNVKYIFLEYDTSYRTRILANAHNAWIINRNLRPLDDADFARLSDPALTIAEFHAMISVFSQ